MGLKAQPQLPPRFDLGNVHLRALHPGDAPAWFAYLSDPEVIKHTSYDIQSIEAVQRMISHYISAYQEKRACRWALARKFDDQLVGTCGFYRWDEAHAVAELGYDLARDHWGNGLMTRTVRTVLSWGFNRAGANRVQATVMVGHVSSARVLEKCGFKKEGTLREYLICRGKPHDFWMFSLVRREYSYR
jgi:ribosomal-protein-alanine N-acetyltransferase